MIPAEASGWAFKNSLIDRVSLKASSSVDFTSTPLIRLSDRTTKSTSGVSALGFHSTLLKNILKYFFYTKGS
jgi:hypothetical protein